MFQSRSSKLRFLSILAVAGTLVTSLASVSMAQGLPGLTIFSGVAQRDQLGYRLDYGGRPGVQDRYHLRIPAEKLEFAVAKLAITYPDTYRGRFDPDEVEVRLKGDDVPLDQVVWDQENRVIEIYPLEPIPADNRLEIVLSNVQNPNRVGTHYFNALALSPGDLPLMRYVGTWILSINYE